ncbi:hypothetical protein HPP92_024835 [Vanilla planifolia]|uniref:protein-serine/threonine phosphatase n=1 Tax=Vanilla planifolia TaxID=51239 RepID=A0A835PGR6_VANPL|nr:hypothetical protein HPP92_024835 [Vanilla planifolia]
MSCSVAVASSQVFSSSTVSLNYKTLPENLALHLAVAAAAADGLSSPAPCSSSFRSFHRGVSSLRAIDSPPNSVLRSSSSASSCSSSDSPSNKCGSASLLKRKRPARLDIPTMGLLALEPTMNSDEQLEDEAECDRYAVYCKRGKKRLEMEDRHRAAFDLGGDSQMAFFGIFDGHGGAKAAQFASENIGANILEELKTKGNDEGDIKVEEAIRNGYLRTDEEFLKANLSGGTCCVTAFVRKGELIVANAGDCRAVMSVSGAAEALTSDHRPSRDDEKKRIESLGGYVDCSRGVWRLQGSLSVSRGIGDSHLKQWVIAEPETRAISIKRECEFLILASDGLWEKVSNQEAVDIARPLCVEASPLSACKKLVNLSVSRGSMDDISVMIIQLEHFM